MKEATKSLLFNGSGYYDNTAYQAIMNVSKEVERMGMRSDYQDGDIVEVTKQNGVVEEMLLLRCHDGYATAVILKEKAPAENSSAVISRQKMYFDAGRPCYVYYDSIGQFVKTVSASELERIRRKVGGGYWPCYSGCRGGQAGSRQTHRPGNAGRFGAEVFASACPCA